MIELPLGYMGPPWTLFVSVSAVKVFRMPQSGTCVLGFNLAKQKKKEDKDLTFSQGAAMGYHIP